ncbi:MAG: type II secretion system protein [Microgenomates group bacterium]
MGILKRKRKVLGVTLPELLVVVSIIVLLITFILWYFRNQIFKGNDGKRKGDIHKIQIAIEEYEKDHNCYPLPSFVICDPGTGLKPYIPKIPCDPTTGASYFYEHEDSTCPSWYRLYANLENLSDEDIAGACGPGYAFNYYETSPNAPDPECTDIENGNGENGGIPSDFYGCFSGVCQSINWDPARPGPVCDPNYKSSTCYYQCTDPDTGLPQNDCQPWDE